MSDVNNTAHYFLTANSPQGFVSRFSELADIHDGWHMLVLKGCPGCGKHTLIQNIYLMLQSREPHPELIHCTADPSKLDAAVFPTLKFCVVDGTRPHSIEPRYPGVYEHTLDLSAYLDTDKLEKSRDRVIALTNESELTGKRAVRFISAAGALISDTYRMSLEETDIGKIRKYAARLAAREFKPIKQGQGKEICRLLSCVTQDGIMMFLDTPSILCDRACLIEDEYGSVSRLLLQALKDHALRAGYDVVACYCPISPFEKLEHLFIPALRIGYMTSNHWHPITVSDCRTIHARRFLGPDALKNKKARIRFNRKASLELLGEAGKLIYESKMIHDDLESYYGNCMDFSQLDTLAQQIVDKVLKKHPPIL